MTDQPSVTATASATAAAKELDWRRGAACAHLSERSVFARLPAEAEPVLHACGRCPIRKQCEAVVDPSHTWFDGVSGGRLWRNGREVTR
ncbi:hypothetical protein OG288_23055 [Streptomyces tauricus]|uniref:4Fe-4S Wbl-type domain-containing protein n=1 Tax=Streptomyces tauricus TaxID=68274 RepID=A0ABZ1JI41_9ACTN|nr:hypothetical protein [Streptomyces tauricus]